MPLFLEDQLHAHGQLAVWKLEETSEQLLALLPTRVQEEQLREPIKNELLFRQRLASRILLAHLLPHDEIVLGKTGVKRTVLLQPTKHISISHAGLFAAVIVSHAPVGIDVEEVSDRISKISGRFISSFEWSYLKTQTDYRGMMLLWSVKEAVFKYANEVEIEFKTDIICKPFVVKEAGTIKVTLTKLGQPEQLEVAYQLFNGYVLSWVSATKSGAA